MARDKVICALDVGSSKIATIIAASMREEKLSVVGVSSVPSKGLRKGQVVDIEETVAAISQSVEAAERMAGVSIGSAFISVGGAHIASQNSKGVVAVSEPEGEITAVDIERVVEAAKAVSLPSSREILHVLPRDFMVDGAGGIKDPTGMTGVRLEVDTHIVTGATTSIRNLVKCVGEVGIDTEAVVFSGLASSEAVLSDTEKELGVILVDIGAGTTDVAIWVDGSLSYCAVLPVGARNVTNDIAVGLRVSLESAEKIKLLLSEKTRPKFAVASAEAEDLVKIKGDADLDLSALSLPEELKKVSRKTLIEGIIKPRLVEIFTFVGMEIQKSGFGGMTPSGVVVTGGGAETVGVLEACRSRLVMPCRVGAPLGTTEEVEFKLSGLIDELKMPASATSVGLILYGAKGAPLRLRRMRGGLPTTFLPNLDGLAKMLSNLPLGDVRTKLTKLLKTFLP